jgi:ribosome-associated protein
MPKRPYIQATAPDAGTNTEDVDENGYSRPSKSHLKREMTALQELGEALTQLSKDGLKKVPMPEKLDDAIREARRITSHEGRRRQIQYVGKVMRSLHETEVAAIRHALEVMKGMSDAETARMHAIERWRGQLLKSDEVLTDFIRRYPQADPQEGRMLIRHTRRETEQKKPPRYFRELFQWIKTTLSDVHRNEDALAADGEANEGDEHNDRDYYKPE